MHTVETYFGFHPRLTWKEYRLGAKLWSILGHVEAWGYTVDDTWWFLDPGRMGTRMIITHRYDDVNELLAERFQRCSEIIRTAHDGDFSNPIHFPMNCATQCGALVGIKAITPAGLRRKLLATRRS